MSASEISVSVWVRHFVRCSCVETGGHLPSSAQFVFQLGPAISADLQTKLQSLVVAGIDERITVSIGLCTIDADSILTDADVQRKANDAKQFAKKNGKNCIGMYKSSLSLERDLYIP